MNPFRRVGHDVLDTHPTASYATSPADPGATDAMRSAPAETLRECKKCSLMRT